MPEKITVIPYRDPSKNQLMNLLLVEPIERLSRVTDNGLIIAEDVGKEFEESKVIAVCENSLFSPGDIVTYRKLDREKKDLFEYVKYDDKQYDVIGESEVWSVNDFPYNRIFIEPDTELEQQSQLIIPGKVEGITQKGTIVSAPINSFYKKGDRVEYRRNNMGAYFNATIDGVQAEVLYEPDIYLLNGKVSPHKIIVRIDMAAQKIKKETTETGLLLSPIYQYMLYNLQYGEVMEVGEEALKFYPEIEVGDTAILHHMVESEDFRLVRKENGTHGTCIYEYRVINCLDKKHREIFGRMEVKKDFPTFGKGTTHLKITPFGEHVFMKWNFEFLNKDKDKSPLSLIELPGFEDCTNKLELMDEIDRRRKAGVESYKIKMGGYQADMTRLEGTEKQVGEAAQRIVTKINNLRRDQEKAAAYVNGDHLLVCTQEFPRAMHPKSICTYKQLYAINILGHKYLIADKDYIFLNINNMDNTLIATGEKVLVKPIIEEKNSGILIPDSAREIPQKGTVISVGPLVVDPNIKAGNTILYRKGAGMPLTHNKVEYFIMKQGDVIAKIENFQEAEVVEENQSQSSVPELVK